MKVYASNTLIWLSFFLTVALVSISVQVRGQMLNEEAVAAAQILVLMLRKPIVDVQVDPNLYIGAHGREKDEPNENLINRWDTKTLSTVELLGIMDMVGMQKEKPQSVTNEPAKHASGAGSATQRRFVSDTMRLSGK